MWLPDAQASVVLLWNNVNSLGYRNAQFPLKKWFEPQGTLRIQAFVPLLPPSTAHALTDSRWD